MRIGPCSARRVCFDELSKRADGRLPPAASPGIDKERLPARRTGLCPYIFAIPILRLFSSVSDRPPRNQALGTDFESGGQGFEIPSGAPAISMGYIQQPCPV